MWVPQFLPLLWLKKKMKKKHLLFYSYRPHFTQAIYEILTLKWCVISHNNRIFTEWAFADVCCVAWIEVYASFSRNRNSCSIHSKFITFYFEIFIARIENILLILINSQIFIFCFCLSNQKTTMTTMSELKGFIYSYLGTSKCFIG